MSKSCFTKTSILIKGTITAGLLAGLPPVMSDIPPISSNYDPFEVPYISKIENTHEKELQKSLMLQVQFYDTTGTASSTSMIF